MYNFVNFVILLTKAFITKTYIEVLIDFLLIIRLRGDSHTISKIEYYIIIYLILFIDCFDCTLWIRHVKIKKAYVEKFLSYKDINSDIFYNNK